VSVRTVGSINVEFICPRCSATVETEFYGPCPACRDQLRVTLAREAKVVEVGEYEPKMNVTPNAVALKDD
jgi:Zn finger protein HypA/HybF involved in hydrogenase expression